MRKDKMERSLLQISTSYAPGALFTFEGGRGGYLSVGTEGRPVGQGITQYASNIIFTQIEESARNWMQIARNSEAEFTRPQDCLDSTFLQNDKFRFSRNHLELVKPEAVGFQPMPTVFFCEACKVVASPKSNSSRDALKLIKRLKQSNYTTHGRHSKCEIGCCKWKQLDVVFIHPNGAILPGRPERYDKYGFKPRKCDCGGKEHMIYKSSPKISEWKYKCSDCGNFTVNQWRQNETSLVDYYISNNEPNAGLTSPQLMHARMFPVPYLSNTVFYPKTGSALDFNESEFLKPDVLLDDVLLKRTLAELLGMESSLSDDDIIMQAQSIEAFSKRVSTYTNAKGSIDILNSLPDSEQIQKLIEVQLTIMEDSMSELRPQFSAGESLPQDILTQVQARPQWSQKYDPIRLLFEHEALSRSFLDVPAIKGGRRKFVPFDKVNINLDDDFVTTTGATAVTLVNEQVTLRMSAMGIRRAGLIREISVINYSYGFSRVSPMPTHTRGKGTEPVRLNLFERVPIAAETSRKHPVYVQQAKNESLYFQLDHVRVAKWLKSVGAVDVPTDLVGLREYLLKHHKPIGTYVDNVEPVDGQLQPFMAAYTLLHTFSHQVMNMVAELSGLEISSLGEYLFPLDMAVLIYRKGTTQDLGNFSSLWRNHQTYLFDYLLDPNTLRCSSGVLCGNRGGACPGCILVPETSCIASNRLLSRGALTGKGRTKEAGIGTFNMQYFSL